MTTIRFSVDDAELATIEHEAKARGLTRAQFAKMATFAYIIKYPSKGVLQAISARWNRATAQGSESP
jgi:hypothetical protein